MRCYRLRQYAGMSRGDAELSPVKDGSDSPEGNASSSDAWRVYDMLTDPPGGEYCATIPVRQSG